MSIYNKPHLTFEQQLALLKSRGLEVTDEKAALEYLRRLGYYRLSGYLYPFRANLQTSQEKNLKDQTQDTFLPGAKFQDAVLLYVFDKKLRLLILDAIERIEVALRVDIAYLLGKEDPYAYANSNLLHGNFTIKTDTQTGKTKHQEWLTKLEQLVLRSKEKFVTHYKIKYGLPLPIWVAIELWDFGLLSTFYQGMRVNDKLNIAEKYAIPDWRIMENWLRCLNYARNITAHHSRLWNKNLIDRPKLPRPDEMVSFNPLLGNADVISRVYVVLCILAHFIGYISPRSSWQNRVIALIQSFPCAASISLKDMGFPEDWRQHSFWMGT
jgi:abortive infection bacteriophage resistance protein